MKNYLVLKFNDSCRREAMMLHNEVDKYPIEVARVCYIAGWISIDGDTQLTKITNEEVEFKIANKKFNVKREYLDDVNFEEIKYE